VTSFVLLHGGGLGPWSWEPVQQILEAAGHPTVAPQLPLDDAGLRENANRAAAAVGSAASEGDLVVVGHALGCSVLPLVAGAVAAHRMIWVCGMIPCPGLSCADQIVLDPSAVPMFEGEALARAGTPEHADRFVDSLLHDCAPAMRAWAEPRLEAHGRRRAAVSVATDPFPSDPWPAVPSTCVLATDDRALSAAWLRRAARERLGVTPVEVPGGHCPMLSRPDRLVAVLTACVETPGRGEREPCRLR
jgi:pimeloyl-ACP methyl ester carboxylesterase